MFIECMVDRRTDGVCVLGGLCMCVGGFVILVIYIVLLLLLLHKCLLNVW